MRAKNVIAHLRATKPTSFTESINLYRSTSANFSAYLVTARLLPYVGAELTRGGIVEFTFHDPEEKGPSLFHSTRSEPRNYSIREYCRKSAMT